MLVHGRAYFRHGLPAGNVPLRFYHIGFNAAATELAFAVTDDDGSYRVEFAPRSVPVNLQVRTPAPGLRIVPGAAAGGRVAPRSVAGRVAVPAAVGRADLADESTEEIWLTDVRYRADSGDIELNLVIPNLVRPLGGEYGRLTDDVRPYLDGAGLGAAREDSAARDLTLLHHSTSWDARLIALAARADELSVASRIDPQALYGLLRAGLPAHPVQLARVSGEAVARALETANAAGVIALTDADIAQAREAFADFARTTRHALASPGTGSTYGELLAATGLPADARDTFDQVFTEHLESGRAGDVTALWDSAREAGLPVPRLQTAARLGYLTLSNADLVADLLRGADERGADERGVDEPAALGPVLVEQRLYDSAQWTERITGLARGDEAALAGLVPPAYTGATTAERLAAYAEDMARKVRLSYPTQVVAHRVGTDQLVLGPNHDSVKSDVVTVLDRAPQLGFSLGRTPLNRFLADHGPALFAGLPAPRAAAATAEVKKLQRLYQMTPSDEAMKVLLDNGFGSAHDVTALSQDTFVHRYGDKFPSQQQAIHVYRKAQQITTVTYTFMGAAKQLATAPGVPVVSPPAAGGQEAKEALVKQFPTLESLFGSLDFCECDHCRSVLSPAAYFVDILKFLDPDGLVWTGDLKEWEDTHGGAPYPFPDLPSWNAAGQPPPRTPYEVLRARRPDLPKLPLTCENTNTAMPYIDIVNEILESYVVHQSLSAMPVYDTGTATSEDLLAEPANLTPAAYDILAAARYPLTLPFDLWLETVRGFAEHFDAPLWKILDALRRTDELDPTGGEPYGRAAVFLERLGVPPAEQAILTDPAPLPTWRELYGYDSTTVTEPQALAELRAARPLARRLRVSYRELVALVRTSFVNPHLDSLATLRRLDIGIEDTLRYREQPGHAPFSNPEKAAFEAKLDPAGVAWLQAVDLDRLGAVLVLADPSAGCGFDTTTLQHLDGTAAEPMVFVRLNYLVRLWRRLGWSIEETDNALRVFLPTTPDPRTAAGIGPALASALLGLAHYDTLAGLLKAGRKTRQRLFALWSTLDDRRYAELFLTGDPQTRDAAFDHPLGHYLSAGGVALADHLPPVLAALGLTADEVAQILAEGGIPDPAPLSLATVSTLYRHGLLAKLLRLPVADLIALKGLTGLDPFTPPPAAPVTMVAEDHALVATIGFVEAALAVRDSGLSIADLQYLLRHRFEPVGPHRDAASPPLALLRTLAAGIARIRAEHAAPADPLALTDEILRQKFASAFPPDVADTLLRMWTGTAEYRAVVPALPADQLQPADFAAVPALTVTYDPVRQEQALTYRGVLLPAERTALPAKVTGSQPGYLSTLLDAVQQQPVDFFDRYLLRETVPGVGETGFLEPADYGALFAAPPLGQDAERDRRARLADTFLPYLRDRLVHQLVVTTVAAELAADPALTAALLATPALLDDPDQPGQPLLAAYAAAGHGGVTVTATGPDSVTVSGYLEVPATGPYRFFVPCPSAGVQVRLAFDHLTDPLLDTTTTGGELEPSAHTELRAGTPYGFTLELSSWGGGEPALLVQGGQLAKGPLSRLVGYPRAAVDKLHRVHLLLAKTLGLVAELGLTEAEVRHLLGHPADFDGLDLGELPTRAADDSPARAQVLFGQFRRLVAYVRLRRQLAAEPADLVGVLAGARRVFAATVAPAAAEQQTLDELCARLAGIVRRDPAVVRAAVDELQVTAQAQPGPDPYPVTVTALANERGLDRLWQVLTLATRIGVSPAALGRWATPEPDLAVARDLRDTVKARYEPEVWRRVVQPIADRLRRRRRDALVAHILHSDGFDSLEQLFEFFLVDPGTEPVVQTSRLRLAISSVQLFVQRCLLNLEPQVSPSAINAAHWQWMKRYRVWEANRKIFLWPENWLEPEFRLDKSHLCAALESTLLQTDLSNDSAEDAFYAYLRGLEELARLDIRAVYVQERPDPADNVLHVVGRTFGSPHKYFYRRYAHRMWTPWEPLSVDIEGDHCAVTVWRGRVHVFWVLFAEEAGKPSAGSNKDATTSTLTLGALTDLQPKITVRVQLNWTQRFQGEWGPRASSDFLTKPSNKIKMALNSGNAAKPPFSAPEEFTHVSIADDGAVRVHLTGALNWGIRLVSRNAAPTVGSAASPLRPPFGQIVAAGRGRYRGSGGLSVHYRQEITVKNGTTSYSCPTEHDILGQASEYHLVTHGGELHGFPYDVGRLVLPFFLGDDRHTFYVEPTLTEKTIEDSDWYIVDSPLIAAEFDRDKYWEIAVAGHVPVGPGPVELFAPEALFDLSAPQDWATRPDSLVPFGAELIGPGGGLAPHALEEEL